MRPLQKGLFLPPALFANAHLLLNTLPLLLSLRTKISVFCIRPQVVQNSLHKPERALAAAVPSAAEPARANSA